MKIALVGLGYVGLPIAIELSRHYEVIGFDISQKKIESLSRNIDPNQEVETEKLKNCKVKFTSNPEMLKEADFVIVAVPTPIHEDSKLPDLNPVESASGIVGKNLKKNAIIVYESTVYPGVTEDVCVPIIEKESGMKCGKEWKIAYSPERIVPGDKVHTLTTITKIVSGMDAETLEKVAEVYGKICPIHKASSIKVAEASKVIENIQRDLNIALVNELSLIFHNLGIDTREVLIAAGTKWNFHKYHPGLVGGHCIGVDPYYLTYISEKNGYYPKVILSGREVNEHLAIHIAKEVMKKLSAIKPLAQCRVLIMGLTFKENVSDMRNSKVKDLIKELKSYGIEVIGFDPWLGKEAVMQNFGIGNIEFNEIPKKIDAVILAQGHEAFRKITLQDLKGMMDSPILFDIKWFYDKKEAKNLGFDYMEL